VAERVVPSVPPGVSAVARHAMRRLFRPIERFMEIEASSGLALLACTAKLAVLAASVLASVVALSLGRLALPVANEDVTTREAERSAED